MTSKEERVIKTAAEFGYNEFPKGISPEQLAEKLEISSTEISEILSEFMAESDQLANRQTFPGLNALADKCVFCSVIKEIEESGGLSRTDDILFHRHLYREHFSA